MLFWLISFISTSSKLTDRDIIGEITTSLCKGSPINQAIEKGGPLSSAYQRNQYYKANFDVVEPVQYILDAEENRTFQCIPILESLKLLLSRKDIVDKIVYCTVFFSGQELRVSIGLYVDDFDMCDPLGTSRKTHKLCAVYWVLSNLPPGSHSSLSSAKRIMLSYTVMIRF